MLSLVKTFLFCLLPVHLAVSVRTEQVGLICSHPVCC